MSSDIRHKHLQGVLWNWKPVADVLPGKCGVCDLDGVIERNGHFLFMECKHPNEKLSKGQEIMLRQLSKLSDKVTVVLVYGDRETGKVESFQKMDKDGLGEKQPGDAFTFAIKKWWRRVNDTTTVRHRDRRHTGDRDSLFGYEGTFDWNYKTL